MLTKSMSKGVGALIIRKGTKIAPLLHGGGQERGCVFNWKYSGNYRLLKRPTGNCTVSMEAKKIGRMRDRLEKYILENIDGAYINVIHLTSSHQYQLSIQGLEGETCDCYYCLMKRNCCVSSSACSSNNNPALHMYFRLLQKSIWSPGSIE